MKSLEGIEILTPILQDQYTDYSATEARMFFAMFKLKRFRN